MSGAGARPRGKEGGLPQAPPLSGTPTNTHYTQAPHGSKPEVQFIQFHQHHGCLSATGWAGGCTLIWSEANRRQLRAAAGALPRSLSKEKAEESAVRAQGANAAR